MSDNNAGTVKFGIQKKLILATVVDLIFMVIIGCAAVFFGDNRITLAVTGLLAAVSLASTFSLSKSVSKPLLALIETASSISGGDLTSEIPEVKSGDEIQMLADSFRAMVWTLVSVVRELQHSAGDIAQTGTNLTRASSESTLATEQIAATAKSIADGAQAQRASAADAVGAVDSLGNAVSSVESGVAAQEQATERASLVVEETGRSIGQVLGSLEALGVAATENAGSAQAGSDAVGDVVASMAKIRETTGSASDSVKQLSALSQQIREIVDIIGELAEQTNLLSLNAAIEAARAGEHGRGFAVVAEEVRKLAERSSGETKRISDLISQIAIAIDRAVSSMEAGSKEVSDGNRVAEDAGKALVSIFESAGASKRLVAELQASSHSLRDGSIQIREAMSEILHVTQGNREAAGAMSCGMESVKRLIDSSAAVSEESAAATEEVLASVEDMTGRSKRVTDEALSLAGMARNLQAIVERFKVDQ